MLLNAPSLGQFWRYTGPDTRCSKLLYRIIHATGKEVGAIQESMVPSWSWGGSVIDFLTEFTFCYNATEKERPEFRV